MTLSKEWFNAMDVQLAFWWADVGRTGVGSVWSTHVKNFTALKVGIPHHEELWYVGHVKFPVGNEHVEQTVFLTQVTNSEQDSDGIVSSDCDQIVQQMALFDDRYRILELKYFSVAQKFQTGVVCSFFTIMEMVTSNSLSYARQLKAQNLEVA